MCFRRGFLPFFRFLPSMTCFLFGISIIHNVLVWSPIGWRLGFRTCPCWQLILGTHRKIRQNTSQKLTDQQTNEQFHRAFHRCWGRSAHHEPNILISDSDSSCCLQDVWWLYMYVYYYGKNPGWLPLDPFPELDTGSHKYIDILLLGLGHSLLHWNLWRWMCLLAVVCKSK